jgi:non-canonical (house-cleaning) NTP pyrophosphatase
MKKSSFKFQVISVQLWNNNKEQLISEHKTMDAAEKQVKSCRKNADGNTYKIVEI